MTQLARQFEEHPEVRYGLTAMCVGIGMGGTVIWENPHHAGRRHASRSMSAPTSSSGPLTTLRGSRRGRHHAPWSATSTLPGVRRRRWR